MHGERLGSGLLPGCVHRPDKYAYQTRRYRSSEPVQPRSLNQPSVSSRQPVVSESIGYMDFFPLSSVRIGSMTTSPREQAPVSSFSPFRKGNRSEENFRDQPLRLVFGPPWVAHIARTLAQCAVCEFACPRRGREFGSKISSADVR